MPVKTALVHECSPWGRVIVFQRQLELKWFPFRALTHLRQAIEIVTYLALGDVFPHGLSHV